MLFTVILLDFFKLLQWFEGYFDKIFSHKFLVARYKQEIFALLNPLNCFLEYSLILVMVEKLEHLKQIGSIETISISSELPHKGKDSFKGDEGLVEFIVFILWNKDIYREFGRYEGRRFLDFSFDLVFVLDAFLDHGLHFFRDLLGFFLLLLLLKLALSLFRHFIIINKMLRVITRSRAGIQSAVGLSHRTFFGGKKPEKIDPNTTEFDLLIVGEWLFHL